VVSFVAVSVVVTGAVAGAGSEGWVGVGAAASVLVGGGGGGGAEEESSVSVD
jgi:hypothetical protein